MQLTGSLPSAFLASLALLACSDPAPPVAQGGLQFNTSTASPVVSGKTCTTSGYLAGVGNPPPDLSGNEPGHRIVDGEGAKISCRVSGGNTVTFSGDVEGRNVLDTNAAFGVSFHIDGKLNEDGTGTASVSINTPQVGTLQNDAAQLCTLEGVVTNDKQNWGDGLIWTQFVCNQMISPSSPGTACSTSGTVVLENCGD